MTKMILVAIAAMGLAYAAPAFADGQGEHPNGTVAASMMTDGSVKMMVTMPAKEFQAMDSAMKAGHNACTIQEIYPGATDTMVLVCNGLPGGG
ncbi:MAG: hypothetical protein B7Z75_08995 [Acidocella sp. 20-57-95]|nr:MAG: hypothetical protein B7Z75_08995 [Acidocella sp. 20-57-95]OYV62431.1 MAG: hypothetical protein B7Z71_01220 [Acidocella sp. 21-58-7]HQT64208.1 hypothetical protein [Acidocella sp.]HQU03865.1 hypothetical protein [Acidocella sp.]